MESEELPYKKRGYGEKKNMPVISLVATSELVDDIQSCEIFIQCDVTHSTICRPCKFPSCSSRKIHYFFLTLAEFVMKKRNTS